MLVAGLRAMASGPDPVLMVAIAVRVLPSMTVTDRSPWLTMYALLVVSLTAIAIGCCPVAMSWAAARPWTRRQREIARVEKLNVIFICGVVSGSPVATSYQGHSRR